jgi:ABC-2 type transport system ATP-binding protein
VNRGSHVGDAPAHCGIEKYQSDEGQVKAAALRIVFVRPMNAIALHNISKRFGTHLAVDDLSLEVPTGSVYGFIGPNGSGKTTTIRMILHILLPDSGRIEVFGDGRTDLARDKIGYLPEERGLYKKMKVQRLLRYYGRLKSKPLADIDKNINRWIDRMDLRAWLDKPVEALSKGMSQKVQFIASVVADPDLLILDEPFSGLDPVNAEVLKDAVLDVRRAGTTIVFSTHDMAVAERMCDRIFMIYKGKKVLDGTMDQIQAAYGADTVRVRVDGGAAVLRALPEVTSVNDYGQMQEVRCADPQALLAALVTRARVQHFEITRPSLHDIFVRIARPSAVELVQEEATRA